MEMEMEMEMETETETEMESREDLKSILPFLPLLLRSSTLFWPSQVVEALKSMAAGPDQSGVDSGEALFHSISNIRQSLSLANHRLASSTKHGYALFFDKLMPETESMQWFGEVIPALGNLLLRLPSLLETHLQNADELASKGSGKSETGLRLLASQVAGTVYLSQELIGALLACAFFCLFPVIDRHIENLPTINFDCLFAILYDGRSKMQENKIQCIIHYFRRICSNIPMGFVSFERKVLPLENCAEYFCCPKANFWINSTIPLCQFKVKDSGLIEDQTFGALEVDFANEYLGGGALHSGCVQEEIRFMINPELIIGMLFLPAMADNEAIEIVGAERFSNYTGYAFSFRFAGNHVDKQEIDSLGRRKTFITAIDALCSPGMRQYRLEFLLREVNKAFCGFFDQSKYKQYERLFLEGEEDVMDHNDSSRNNLPVHESTSDTRENFFGKSLPPECLDHKNDIGIATGNWGCGAFGGDPQVKSIIQWLAASQALRPLVLYYTFGIEALQNLEKGGCFRSSNTLRAYKNVGSLRSGDGKKKKAQADMNSDEEDDSSSADRQDPNLMDVEERREWREKIREVIDMNPNVEEEVDNLERRRKMQKLLADYPLVVEEEDPDWPEDADGWGFNLGQFFDKITIKNKKNDDKDDDDKDDDNDIVWQDDNYIRPIKDITTAEWEEAVFKDISPLIIFVHNRYKRPKEDEKIREELEKAIHIIWNCNLPSPRCVAVDAVVERNLVSALQVSAFPEIIFTKAGKILYREKGFVSADELSKIMAFFYYGAAKPPCLNDIGDSQEAIPSISVDA